MRSEILTDIMYEEEKHRIEQGEANHGDPSPLDEKDKKILSQEEILKMSKTQSKDSDSLQKPNSDGA